jgi:hypothetical protein
MEKDWKDELSGLITFSTFILSLNTAALVHLGELPDPITKKKEVNLTLAKQTIDTLEMLKEKTKGNLTLEEEKLLQSILYELKLKYVKLVG